MAKVVDFKFLKEKLLETESSESNKICTVGIIGNCHLSNKDIICNQLVGQQVFSSETGKSSDSAKTADEVVIKLFHDESQRIVYLQLSSILDRSSLVKACRKIHDNISLTGQHQFWQEKEFQHAAALLLMFSICHIVLVSFPLPRFDLSYLRLFKLLASVRHGMLHNISNVLSNIEGIPEIWKTTGRPCIPRIIFAFQVPWSKGGNISEKPSLTKIQQSLQEQIHLILKKNRLLGSLSSSSLFTVSSPNQAFVYVQDSSQLFSDPVHWCIDQLLKNSVNVDHVLNAMRGKGLQTSFVSQPPVSPGDDSSNSSGKKTLSFQDFLFRQIDYMMTVESRDVPAEGRRGTHVEAPVANLWYRVCEALFEFFLGSENENTIHMKNAVGSLDLDWKFSESRCRKVLPLATNAYLDNLPSHYTHTVHLSQLSQALHVFTLNGRGPAFEHYMAQLQEDCSQIWWNGRQLCEERSMTGQPCVYPFHRVPDGKDLSPRDDNSGIPCKPHSSRVTSIAACNCGRTQGTREDPFDLRTANYEFYQELEKKCCSYLIHLHFPGYPVEEGGGPLIAGTTQELNMEPDTTRSSPAPDTLPQEPTHFDSQTNIHSMPSIPSIKPPILSSKDTTATSVPSATGLSIGYHFTAELTGTDFHEDSMSVYSGARIESRTDHRQDMDGMHAQRAMGITHLSCPTDAYTRRKSRNEFIDTMLTIETSPGLLPLFSSWSLLLLGPASLYNPQRGLEQHGFFSGSNYLLPWEIPFRDNVSSVEERSSQGPKDTSDEEQWPVPGASSKSTGPGIHLPLFQTITKLRTLSTELHQKDIVAEMGNKSSGKQQKGSKDDTSKSRVIKAYIGNEYECPRGHRFFCSSPDKMVKASSSGHLRETATKLITSDMPLYFPCPCRSSKPLHLAQLSRVYCVTPDSPVTIRLNPRVQPGEKETTPTFYTGSKNGICLPPNNFCVLKLPYVFVGENGPIHPPMDSQPLLTCRVFKGLYTVGV